MNEDLIKEMEFTIPRELSFLSLVMNLDLTLTDPIIYVLYDLVVRMKRPDKPPFIRDNCNTANEYIEKLCAQLGCTINLDGVDDDELKNAMIYLLEHFSINDITKTRYEGFLNTLSQKYPNITHNISIYEYMIIMQKYEEFNIQTDFIDYALNIYDRYYKLCELPNLSNLKI